MSLPLSSGPLLGLGSARRNISSYLLRIVIVALASMALITLGLLAWNMSSQRRLAEAEMGRTVQAISVALDLQLLVTTAALESLAASMVEDADPERLYRVVQEVQAKHPYWSHVVLRDAARTLLFTTAVPYGTPVTGTDAVAPWLAKALSTGQPQISNLMYGPIARAPVAVVTVPGRGRDGQRFVLSAVVTASKWEALLREERIPEGWVAGIIDQDGVVVARTRAAEQFVGKPAPEWVRSAIRSAPHGHAEGPALEGEPLSLVFSRSAVSGWTVAFAAPTSVFETPLRRALVLTATACSLALGVATLLVLGYARRLSRAVAGLIGVANAMREPGGNVPVLPRTEVEELALVYDSMRNIGVHLREVEDQRVTSMRELQHRVKNDLQAILSLISLENSQSENDEVHHILGELQGRIEALRLVHSRLYEAGRVGTVELGGYLRELCGNSTALYGRSHTGGIAFEASVCEADVDHNTAVSLGLIANEFITNSAKHAFPDRPGTITLDLALAEPDQIRLRLADNGIGLPPNRKRSSGLQLIAALAEQVGAEPEWTVNAGTCLQLSFSVRDARQAA